jgi:hypothetical protein
MRDTLIDGANSCDDRLLPNFLLLSFLSPGAFGGHHHRAIIDRFSSLAACAQLFPEFAFLFGWGEFVCLLVEVASPFKPSSMRRGLIFKTCFGCSVCGRFVCSVLGGSDRRPGRSAHSLQRSI